MNKYTKEEMDKMEAEAFASNKEKEGIDLGFDPLDIVKGDADAVGKFKKQHEAAKGD